MFDKQITRFATMDDTKAFHDRQLNSDNSIVSLMWPAEYGLGDRKIS